MVYTEAMGPAAYIARARTVPLRNMGAALSPLNAFLILQGIETLSLRMERHCDNALAVANYLKDHDKIDVGQLRRAARFALLRPGAEVHQGQTLGPDDLWREGRLRRRV